MSLPFFFVEELPSINEVLMLDEDTSKHIVQVLRMKQGAALLLTNGKGIKATAIITDDHRKRCAVTIEGIEKKEAPPAHIAIAVSLIKNTTRFEWLVEKATEMGISQIIPMLCERTEKEKFRTDRIKSIAISAMLQSQQCLLPQVHEPTDFEQVMQLTQYEAKYIAHCLPNEKKELAEVLMNNESHKASLMLIGPEGDFSPAELKAALQNGFNAVALGATRLRTETAAVVAAALLVNMQSMAVRSGISRSAAT